MPLQEEAKTLFDKLRALLAEGGFELCQWASNIPDIINHLSNEARNIYRVLAKQYDPLGFIIPYATRATLVEQTA